MICAGKSYDTFLICELEVEVDLDFEFDFEFEIELDFGLRLKIRIGQYDFEEKTMTSREVKERNNTEASMTPHTRKMCDLLVAEIFL